MPYSFSTGVISPLAEPPDMCLARLSSFLRLCCESPTLCLLSLR